MNDEERKAHRDKLNNFCFVCGKFTIKSQRRHLTADAIAGYNYYFSSIKPVAEMQNVDFAPQFTCIACIEALSSWWKGKRYSLPFGLPFVWSDPGDHRPDNCYVCMNNMFYRNRNNRSGIVYRGVPSARVPVPHSDKLPVPMHPSQINSDNPNHAAQSQTTSSSSQPSDSDFMPPVEHPLPSLISQDHLDRMVRKLKLSHDHALALASELKSARILAPGVEIQFD